MRSGPPRTSRRSRLLLWAPSRMLRWTSSQLSRLQPVTTFLWMTSRRSQFPQVMRLWINSQLTPHLPATPTHLLVSGETTQLIALNWKIYILNCRFESSFAEIRHYNSINHATIMSHTCLHDIVMELLCVGKIYTVIYVRIIRTSGSSILER